SGSCNIISEGRGVVVRERTLFLIDKGRFKVDAKVGCSGSFEQILFSLDAEALFGRLSRDTSRSERRFEYAILTGIVSTSTIEDVASQCCTSLSTFKRRFAKRFAHSPHCWFLHCRLDIAERIIGYSGVTVADLAQMCGFSNTSHFICAYRHRFGTTPSRHARQRKALK
ncbi:MAG: helix-turn-helix transcriptional regulator, partial [Rikenellaceae bacterium]|nr:helix-turn-helix transcriptional regulator [Rikenellaceae bacterium]